MGEVQGTLFRLEFNRSVRVRSVAEEKVTKDGGAVLLREVGERLGLWRLLEGALENPRESSLITHPFVELLRTAILTGAQGCGSQRHVDFLRGDPAFRLAVSKRRGERPLRPRREGVREPEGLASQPTMSRLMAALSSAENRERLLGVLCTWAAHRAGLSETKPRAEVTVDVDSLPIEVHGHQMGSARNGHYHCRCFHPLIVSWEFGDFLGAQLREGNVHTADEALPFIQRFLSFAGRYAERVWLRMDAGFPSEPFLKALESQEHRYVARIKTNKRLNELAWPYVDEIADKTESEERVHAIELEYAARSWSRTRRVVLIIDERPLELYPHYFFLVTNASPEEEGGLELLERYRGRGSTEKDYGEWLNALDLSLSSTNRPKSSYRGQPPGERRPPVDSFAVNEAMLLVSLLSANLLHSARVLEKRAHTRLSSREALRRHALEAAGHVACSARYVTLWIADKHTEYWARITDALALLPSPRASPSFQALPSSP
jgi:hypothetical protein